MLRKIFHWFYKTRSSYGHSRPKMEGRSKERDLFHYFHEFGGDGMNVRRSYWLYRKVFKFVFWLVFLLLAGWFAYESYHGLMIYDT